MQQEKTMSKHPAAGAGFGVLLAIAAVAAAADYPQRPVRLVVPSAPGGAMDIVARVISPRLGEELGQQIVVDNRGGAAGNIGNELAARAAPDGYTVLIGNIGTISINPSLYPGSPVRPLRDLAPITQIVDTPNSLVINPSLPARTVKTLVDYAKANPDKLNVGSPSSNRLESEYFMRTAGISMVRILYKGGAGPALTALLGNEISVLFTPLSSSIGFIKGGRLIALAVMAPRRVAALPDVPTMAESGIPGMTSGSWQGLLVPRATARPIVDRLHAATVKVLAQPDIRNRLANSSVEVVVSRSPEDFGAFIKTETERWAKLVKEAGITAE
jgi:tripartite-type tricarboxylate transporter receptor subunit TctC